ncbi:MAG TPA: rhodanese-like domain-containing protein [Terriglobales bacterium]|nr:rhodanese-like domain-containing protein [Terriglobales bacterium]
MKRQPKVSVERIGLDELGRDLKDIVFVDARSATALARNPAEVPGAIHVPIKALDAAVKKLPHRRPLVTYCT